MFRKHEKYLTQLLRSPHTILNDDILIKIRDVKDLYLHHRHALIGY